MFYILASVFVVLFAIFFITESVATFIFSCILLIIQSILVFLFSREEQRKNIYKVSLLTFVLYSILALLHYNEFICNDVNPMADELRHFIPFVERILKSELTIPQILQESFLYNQGTNIGYYFYIGSVAQFCKYSLGGYNLLQLLMSTVFVGCLYSIILYKFIAIFVSSSKNTFAYTMQFLVFTPIVSYSFMISRDCHIAFFYLLGIYIVLRNKDFKKSLIILFLIMWILASLRLEHSLFFGLFIAYFIYGRFQRYRKTVIMISFLLFVVGIGFLKSTVDMMSETWNYYSAYTMEFANSSGLAMRILSLPSPIKEFACTILSQIFPIPPWASLLTCPDNISSIILSILSMVRTIVWFFIVYSVVWWILRFNVIPFIKESRLFFLLWVSLLLILVCSTEYYESRRIMCVYPIIYATYIVSKRTISIQRMDRTKLNFVGIYSFIILTYLVLV